MREAKRSSSNPPAMFSRRCLVTEASTSCKGWATDAPCGGSQFVSKMGRARCACTECQCGARTHKPLTWMALRHSALVCRLRSLGSATKNGLTLGGRYPLALEETNRETGSRPGSQAQAVGRACPQRQYLREVLVHFPPLAELLQAVVKLQHEGMAHQAASVQGQGQSQSSCWAAAVVARCTAPCWRP